MKKLLLVLLTAAMAFTTACEPAGDGGDTLVAQEAGTPDQEAVRANVQVTILPLPGKSVTVEGTEYDSPAGIKMDFPTSGPFMISVNDVSYALDVESPDGERLRDVFVVEDATIIIGVYGHMEMAPMGTICQCISCDGVTVCGCNPTCPPRE